LQVLSAFSPRSIFDDSLEVKVSLLLFERLSFSFFEFIGRNADFKAGLVYIIIQHKDINQNLLNYESDQDHCSHYYFSAIFQRLGTKMLFWTIKGPTQYIINNTTQPTGMGRGHAIAFHLADLKTI
jgi:hypothetical protein